jgi:hypothetical protein
MLGFELYFRELNGVADDLGLLLAHGGCLHWWLA